MSVARLRHDAAWRAAQTLVSIVAPALRPDEHKDAHAEFYRVVKLTLENYDTSRIREELRIKPSRN